MVEVNSKFPLQTSRTAPVFVNPNEMSDINNVRLRHSKSNIPIETTTQPAHFILSTVDFRTNERDVDLPIISRNKHNKTQIFFLIFTALSYLLHSLRAYIPENIQTDSRFWSNIKLSPITRVYTSELRLSLVIENFLLRLAENFQALWLIYILSYIPRRIHFGYIYRNPNIFDSLFCFLLISALLFQTISRTPVPPEISCACLLLSFILLIASCRLIVIRLVNYEEKIKSIDLIINRYVVLNSLFLYTTSVGYLTICAFIECIAFHFDPNVGSVTLATRTGLSIVFILLLIYFILDQFIYNIELGSIWTPYLFIAIVSICPPLRTLSSIETVLIPDDINFYLLWTLFSTTILMILIRIGRRIFIKYRQMRAKSRVNPYIGEVTLETQT